MQNRELRLQKLHERTFATSIYANFQGDSIVMNILKIKGRDLYINFITREF